MTMPKGKPKQVAEPQKLEDLDVGKHSAKQMSVLIAQHMQMGDAMALPPAEVVKRAKDRLKNGDEPASPVAKPGKGEVKRQLIEDVTSRYQLWPWTDELSQFLDFRAV